MLGRHVCVLSDCIKGKPFPLILGKGKALNFEMGIEQKVNIDCVGNYRNEKSGQVQIQIFVL